MLPFLVEKTLPFCCISPVLLRNALIFPVFVDTGLEYPEIRICKKQEKCTWLKRLLNRFRKYGYRLFQRAKPIYSRYADNKRKDEIYSYEWLKYDGKALETV